VGQPFLERFASPLRRTGRAKPPMPVAWLGPQGDDPGACLSGCVRELHNAGIHGFAILVLAQLHGNEFKCVARSARQIALLAYLGDPDVALRDLDLSTKRGLEGTVSASASGLVLSRGDAPGLRLPPSPGEADPSRRSARPYPRWSSHPHRASLSRAYRSGSTSSS
jgi:hypothetical protein